MSDLFDTLCGHQKKHNIPAIYGELDLFLNEISNKFPKFLPFMKIYLLKTTTI